MMKFPRWLSWLFILALGYIVYSASQLSGTKVTQAPAKPIVPVITHDAYPALDEMTDMERWHRRIDPVYAATMSCTLDTPKTRDALVLSVSEIHGGTGESAVCGAPIVIHLTVWNGMGGKAYEGDLTLHLGSRELAAGFDQGLIGIKPGGERLLVMPPYALMRSKEAGLPKAARVALPAGTLAVVTVRRLK